LELRGFENSIRACEVLPPLVRVAVMVFWVWAVALSHAAAMNLKLTFCFLFCMCVHVHERAWVGGWAGILDSLYIHTEVHPNIDVTTSPNETDH
jgi:hypothetical protein